VTFLNYGYIDSETNQIPLQAADEPDRVFIQLYHHLVGEINLKGLDVLEVSCAHGGGAAYIGRYLKPRSVLGVDFNVKAVDFCRGHFSIEEFAFACGDAESLQFADNTFDVIVNVEASHCYGDMVRFLGEVVRLLRPGGYFLFADFRPTALADTLHEQFIQSGLELVKRKDITPNVLKAMELDSQRRLGLVKELVPRLFQGCAEQVVGIKGSRMFEAFRVGTMVYLSYILRKVDAPI
jgi:SAM-dependent methyltransferase